MARTSIISTQIEDGSISSSDLTSSLQLTGSIGITGSLELSGEGIFLTSSDGSVKQFAIVTDNEISASAIESNFLIISESINVGSGSSIWGADNNDTHEFTGSVFISGSTLTITDGQFAIEVAKSLKRFE